MTNNAAPSLWLSDAAFLPPDTWLGLAKQRLVRIGLTAPKSAL
jgi:hypothetical protein